MNHAWHGWIWALAGFLAGGLVIAIIPASTFFVPPASNTELASGERWACPMMDFIGTHAGPCPVCGMDMTRVTAGELAKEQQRRMGIQTAVIGEGPATVTVRAYGAAEYDDRYSQVIIARISGRIVKRHQATFGCCQDIDVGDPVVDLYSPEAFQAQGELAAAVKTGNQVLIHSIEERFARWNLTPVAAAIIAGKPPVDTVTITSPYAGQAYLDDEKMVSQTLMVGSEVKEDMPLVKLVDAKRLTLVIHIPEAQGRFVRAGQAVRIATDDQGELPDVVATVGRIANELNPMTRTRETRIYLADGRRHLLPGALVQARIQGALAADLTPAEAARPSTWGRFPLIPKSAVLSTGVRNVAWRVRERRADGTVRFEPVSLALGPRIEDPDGRDLFVVRAGLKPGDEVAVQGQFLIDSQAQLAGSASLLFPDGAIPVAVPVTTPGAGDGHGH